MKKKVLPILFTALVLVSCGGSDPAADAKKMCDCIHNAKDNAEAWAKCTSMSVQDLEKYKEDHEQAHLYRTTLEECLEINQKNTTE